MPSIKYTYGVEFDPNASLAISISNAIYDDDGAKYKFRGQINNDSYGNVISQLYNGINICRKIISLNNIKSVST